MTLVVSRYYEAQEVLRSPDLEQALYDAGAPVMKDALITLHGEQHRARRVTEFGVFRRGYFRHYEKEVFPQTLAPLLATAQESGETDLVEFCYAVTMRLTAHFAGVDFDSSASADTDALLQLVKKFSEGATAVHSRRNEQELRAEVEQAMTAFETRFLEPSKRRRLQLVEAFEGNQIDEDALPGDVLTTLLKSRKRLPLADDVLRREIAFFLQAGAHSTANSAVRAFHEISAWSEREGNRRRLSDPLFIQRAVHESLRLFPASPVARRRAVCPSVVVGIDLQPGDLVEVDLVSANRDPEVFGSNADAFDPARVVPRQAWPFGLTFGYGVHACLGRDLDGGVIARPDTEAQSHQLGIVTLLVQALLDSGARADPDRPAREDVATIRSTWSSYPVRFGEVH